MISNDILVDVHNGTLFFFLLAWKVSFLFFPRNLSTSSSVDDRPQYAAIFAEEVFLCHRVLDLL
jgi:hypothetical protein